MPAGFTFEAPVTPSASLGPGSCEGLPGAQCVGAVLVAQTGLFLQPGERVVHWRVSKTVVVTCDGIIQPKFDVLFTIADPAGSISVTVGQYPEGTWAACTY